jgi:multidrug efflux system outer membrane protein
MKKILCLLFLCSCMVGPNYRRPWLDIPSQYRFSWEEEKGSLASLFWENFEDPVLNTLVETALSSNLDIRIQAGNIEQAIGILMQTRATFFPQIGYAGFGMEERTSLNTIPPLLAGLTDPKQTTYEAVGTATWDIDLWGRIRREIQAARANLFATVESRRNVILSVAAACVNGYLQLLGYDAQLEIAKKTLASYGDEVTYFKTQFEYGQTSLMTVAQAETQYQIAASTIPQVELLIVQTENALSVLLGQNPGPIPRGKSLYDLTLPEVPQGIPSQILRMRPDVLQAEFELIAANANIGAAEALYFPDISLTGFYGRASNELTNLFSFPSKTWSYTGSIIGPIYTFGAIQGGVVQAKGAKLSALNRYKQAIINAFSDVETSLASRYYLAEQLEAERKLVVAAQEYTDLATLQHKEGYSPYFVVLQAQEQLFPAELSWVKTRALLFSSVVNIYRSMGGNWVLSAEGLADCR